MDGRPPTAHAGGYGDDYSNLENIMAAGKLEPPCCVKAFSRRGDKATRLVMRNRFKYPALLRAWRWTRRLAWFRHIVC